MTIFARDRLEELVHSIRYQDLPAEVIHEAKRLILDSLACALGGYRSEPSSIARRVARELGGNAEATVIEVERILDGAGGIVPQRWDELVRRPRLEPRPD